MNSQTASTSLRPESGQSKGRSPLQRMQDFCVLGALFLAFLGIVYMVVKIGDTPRTTQLSTAERELLVTASDFGPLMGKIIDDQPGAYVRFGPGRFYDSSELMYSCLSLKLLDGRPVSIVSYIALESSLGDGQDRWDKLRPRVETWTAWNGTSGVPEGSSITQYTNLELGEQALLVKATDPAGRMFGWQLLCRTGNRVLRATIVGTGFSGPDAACAFFAPHVLALEQSELTPPFVATP